MKNRYNKNKDVRLLIFYIIFIKKLYYTYVIIFYQELILILVFEYNRLL